MDLFNRLAQQHLGQAPALHAALAPRFAPRSGFASAGADRLLHEAPSDQNPGGDQQPAAGAESASTPAAANQVLRQAGLDSLVPNSASHRAQRSDLQWAPLAQARDAPSTLHAEAAVATAHPASGWPTSASAHAQHGIANANANARAHAQAQAQAATATPLQRVATHPVRLRAATPSTLARMLDSTPLSRSRVQALAPRMAEPAQAAPVVHVHIDRIEVRAPAQAPRGTPPRATRPAPATSLADYLRSGGPK